MLIKTETNLRNFETWSGATDTKNLIISLGLEEEFELLIDELYPEGIEDIQLNDLLRFDPEWVLEALGVEEKNL